MDRPLYTEVYQKEPEAIKGSGREAKEASSKCLIKRDYSTRIRVPFPAGPSSQHMLWSCCDILLAAVQPFNELHYLQPDQPPPHVVNNDSINGDSHGAHHIVVQDDVVNCSSV